MTLEDTLASIQAQLSILLRLAGNAVPVEGLAPNPANPRITSQQVTKFDNIEIQSDGSVWSLALDGRTPAGQIYGFLTPEKDPVQWDACVLACIGQNPATTYAEAEEWLLTLRGDPWNRFKMSPEVVMAAAPAQRYTRLGEMLSNPLPTPR